MTNHFNSIQVRLSSRNWFAFIQNVWNLHKNRFYQNSYVSYIYYDISIDFLNLPRGLFILCGMDQIF